MLQNKQNLKKKKQVPREWQSQAFSQHSASWGCAYLASPALMAWVGDDADTILSLATATMILSAIIVEITFIDTRPVGRRTTRMSRVVSGYIIEGARDLAEVGKKMSGVDLTEFFNGGRDKDASPPRVAAPPGPPGPRGPPVIVGGGNGDIPTRGRRPVSDARNGNGGREGSALRRRRRGAGPNGGGGGAGGSPSPASERVDEDHASRELAGAGEGGGEAEASSVQALLGVFRSMMQERLVVASFVLQAIRPAQDLAPLVAMKFDGGASVLAALTSTRSLFRVFLPMTPIISMLVRFAGGGVPDPGEAVEGGGGGGGRRSGDRAIAAVMCIVMAGLVAYVPEVVTLQELHQLMAVKGLCHIVRESTAGAVMAGAAASGKGHAGAFFGWQHCIKGIQGMLSHFITGWLSAYAVAVPYYVVAVCDLLYAFTYLYI